MTSARAHTGCLARLMPIVLAAGCVHLLLMAGLVGVSDRFGRGGSGNSAVGASDGGGRDAGLPIDPVKAPAALLWSRRAAEVREAVRHAWAGYKNHAYYADDLKPLSRTGYNNGIRHHFLASFRATLSSTAPHRRCALCSTSCPR